MRAYQPERVFSRRSGPVIGSGRHSDGLRYNVIARIVEIDKGLFIDVMTEVSYFAPYLSFRCLSFGVTNLGKNGAL